MDKKQAGFKGTNFLLLAALLMVIGCSKTKRNFSTRAYHNTTSFFNWYYNANELYKEKIAELEASYPFPDDGFVEVSYLGTEDDIKGIEGDLSEIIRKNDAVMFKHPNGDWVDNCRLLNGKCWFYKKNYTLAMRNFDYFIDNYTSSKHIPEAWFFVARTYYEMGTGELAKAILEDQILYNDTVELSHDLMGEIAIFRAEIAMDEQDYQGAAMRLEEGLQHIKQLSRIARAHFLLGQLFAAQDNYPKSLEQYELVVRKAPDYSLAFEAKIAIARLYVKYQAGKDEEEIVYKFLRKLLKDPKNLEYRDRIYYGFALLERKKNNLEGSLENLTKSIQANMTNQRQLALSYYMSGNIYFDDLKNYTRAQAYFDSAASAIREKDREYDEIKTIASTLKEYVTHLNTIQYQDSMLWLATLPKETLDSLVDGLAKAEQLRKEAEAKRLVDEMQAGRNNFFDPLAEAGKDRNNGNKGSVWYFDNPEAISNGRVQFQNVWGQRPNQDDWRRIKKSSFAQIQDRDEGADGTPIAVDSTLIEAYGDNAQYYADIPDTEKKVQASNQKIESAMYKLGQIYYQKLDEPDSAILVYERLLDRFDDSEITLQARYALYKLYMGQDNPLAFVHQSFILSEHPNSVYAFLIEGRDLNEMKEDEESYMFAYDGLYNAYFTQEYETSIGFSEFLLRQEKFIENANIDIARLQYIRGMSYGFSGRKDSLRSILTYVIKTYPDHEVTPIARQTLDFLDKKNIPPIVNRIGEEGEGVTSSKRPTGTSIGETDYSEFKAEPKPTDKIFVLMYLDKNRLSKSEIQRMLSDFNRLEYSDKNLRVFTFMYQQTHHLPYISHFKSTKEASDYIVKFQASPQAKDLLLTEADKIFYISHTNFKVAYGQKKMEKYIEFYTKILAGK